MHACLLLNLFISVYSLKVIYQSVGLGCPLQREQRGLGHDSGFGLHDGIEGPNLHHPVHIQTGHSPAGAVHPKNTNMNIKTQITPGKL